MEYPPFEEMLRQAIAVARAAGLTESADRLESRATAFYTTGSEYWGEVGEAIHEFLAREGDRVPGALARRFDICLAEIGKVWPKYRPS